MNGIIYAFCDPITCETRYIGMTRYTARARLSARLRETRRGAQTHVARWLRTLPTEPQILLLEEGIPLDQLGQREREWIAAARAWGWRLTNCAEGGEGNPGYTHTPKARARMSASMKGREISTEHRAKLSAALKGRPHTPEHRAAVAAAKRGHVVSPETRSKISETLKDQRQSAATRAKRAEAMRRVWAKRKRVKD